MTDPEPAPAPSARPKHAVAQAGTAEFFEPDGSPSRAMAAVAAARAARLARRTEGLAAAAKARDGAAVQAVLAPLARPFRLRPDGPVSGDAVRRLPPGPGDPGDGPALRDHLVRFEPLPSDLVPVVTPLEIDRAGWYWETYTWSDMGSWAAPTLQTAAANASPWLGGRVSVSGGPGGYADEFFPYLSTAATAESGVFWVHRRRSGSRRMRLRVRLVPVYRAQARDLRDFANPFEAEVAQHNSIHWGYTLADGTEAFEDSLDGVGSGSTFSRYWTLSEQPDGVTVIGQREEGLQHVNESSSASGAALDLDLSVRKLDVAEGQDLRLWIGGRSTFTAWGNGFSVAATQAVTWRIDRAEVVEGGLEIRPLP